MSLSDLENFVLIPGKHGEGDKLYELGKKGSYSENSFALLPYHHPAKQKLNAAFYPVVGESVFYHEAGKQPENRITLTPQLNKQAYLDRVQLLKQHIQLGNIYEINFCQQFIAENIGINPLATFYELYRISKAPYACLVKLGKQYIISASPELFLEKKGNGLKTKPIKGTAPRGKNEAEDLDQKNQLYHSEKERTENVMAVDVARNDLSILATKGSVKVNALYNIETFETVHQMVSTVSCDLKPELDFENIMAATFPMASMTGAPKTRAMDLIDETENFERGFYSGAMGLIAPGGDFTLQVIIRSIFYDAGENKLSLAVGGAITYLSDPEKEYEECLLKAKGLLKALHADIKV